MSKSKIKPKKGKTQIAKKLTQKEKDQLSNENPYLTKLEVKAKQDSKSLTRKMDSPISISSNDLNFDSIAKNIVEETHCKPLDETI